MAGSHFLHLVYHLLIAFKHIFHLIVTFVIFVLIGLKHIFQNAPSKSPYPSLQNPFPDRPKMNLISGGQTKISQSASEYKSAYSTWYQNRLK